MLFNSLEFILVFLPVAFLVYFGLNRIRLAVAGKSWLVLASLVFYAWWNVAYLPLILVSILVNYALGGALAKRAAGATRDAIKAEWLLAAGVGFNLGLLAYYKYADFLRDNFGRLFDAPPVSLGIVLPLAISFFTFTQIAYLVDSYRGRAKEYDLLNYTLFVTFFPHLIAGPIVHHGEIMPQFKAAANLARRYRNVLGGLALFSVGLAKKVLIADSFAVWATAGFDQADTLNFTEAWVSSLSYTFQIYFDFSGYTDMALGAALLFNIRMPFNFDSPYRATNIQDFWRRWHMTLSRFLRDYLYIPLGGSRVAPGRVYVNLATTFVLGGLWHGASWMFVLWGGLHGAAMMLHRIWQRTGLRMSPVLAWLLTFNFINVTWVFFRAQTLEDALKMLRGMAGLDAMGGLGTRFAGWAGLIDSHFEIGAALLAALALVLVRRNSNVLLSGTRLGMRSAVTYGLLGAVSLLALMASKYSEFIYFNF
ncbi:MAG: MBOAT family protein [Thiobacillus sp.]|nr:MBOAT family protein [Thiobacillus sp.]